eukprot:361401-Chlamydomonas_euryale.AAC.13
MQMRASGRQHSMLEGANTCVSSLWPTRLTRGSHTAMAHTTPQVPDRQMHVPAAISELEQQLHGAWAVVGVDECDLHTLHHDRRVQRQRPQHAGRNATQEFHQPRCHLAAVDGTMAPVLVQPSVVVCRGHGGAETWCRGTQCCSGGTTPAKQHRHFGHC